MRARARKQEKSRTGAGTTTDINYSKDSQLALQAYSYTPIFSANCKFSSQLICVDYTAPWDKRLDFLTKKKIEEEEMQDVRFINEEQEIMI